MNSFEKFFNAFIIACFGVIFCGCTVGNIHNNSNLANISSAEQARAEIRIGMTMEEVLAKWGKPSSKRTDNDTINWSYMHLKSTVTGLPGLDKRNQKAVGIAFENGRVSKVSFEELDF